MCSDRKTQSHLHCVPSKISLFLSGPVLRKPLFQTNATQRSRHLAESVDNSSESRLGLVVGVEQERVVLLAPRVLVADTPDSDTDTLGDVEAGLGDGGVVVGRGSADVELSDGNLANTGADKSLKSALDLTSHTGVEMRLGADTVNGDALRDPLLDVVAHAGGDLGSVGRVKAVVVDVQLGVGVSLAGSAEGNADKLLAEDAGEDRVTQTAVPLEDLVDNVPGVDLALVTSSDVGNVVLNDRLELVLVVDVLDPLRQLRVPEEGVAADLDAVLLGKVDDLVGGAEVELALAGLSGIPLHRVLGGDLAEDGLDGVGVLGVGEEVGVGDGTKVLLALVLDQLVEAGLRLAGLDRGGHGRDQRGGEEEGRQLHGE